MTNKKSKDVKTLDEQMLEYSKHHEKVEKLKKELMVNPFLKLDL
jgi:hypothetical protein